MFKKPIFLFITTFIIAIALAFFSSYFIVQKVHGDVGFGSDIDMGGNKILNVGEGVYSFDAINLDQFNSSAKLCLKGGGSKGDDSYCILSWCDINDFSFCGTQDDFHPFDGPEDGSCFTADTPILMADGKYKPIKEVKEGDWVLTKENQSSNKMVSAKVTKTFEHIANSYLIINNELKVTDIHPIFVDNKWKQAKAIKLGDKLLNEKGQETVVESLEVKRETVKVYNLEIEGCATYFAGGIYVHNKVDGNPEM